MMRLRSVFLTSENPEVAARFYAQVAQLPMEKVGVEGGYIYWRMDWDGMQLAIHDAKAFADYAHPALPDSNLTHLYFSIEDRFTSRRSGARAKMARPGMTANWGMKT